MNTSAIKFFLTALVIMSSVISLWAQTSAGTFSVGGAMSFSGSRNRDNNDEVKSTTYYFAPTVGYFISDNLMAGAALSMSVARNDYSNGNNKTTNFGLGPLLRYYKFTSNEQFAFYGEFGFSFGLGRYEANGGDPTKSSSFNMYLSPGFTWFPTPHWGVDLSISLLNFNSYDPDKDTDGDKDNSFTFGFNTFTPSLGVRYFIH